MKTDAISELKKAARQGVVVTLKLHGKTYAVGTEKSGGTWFMVVRQRSDDPGIRIPLDAAPAVA